MDDDGFTIVRPKKGKGKGTRTVSRTAISLNNSKTSENHFVDIDKFIR
jgi:hypothetical protein